MTASRSLLILGCSQRKKRTSRLIPAIDRYDGPVFQVLRKHARNFPESLHEALVLSGRFGLIAGDTLIPRYNHFLKQNDLSLLRGQVEKELKRTLDKYQPERLFVSVGSGYWPLLEKPLSNDVAAEKLTVASGSIGGRASQLAHWLRSERSQDDETLEKASGEATLLGTTVRLSSAEVLRSAKQALIVDPQGARRFETWYVEVGNDRVAPKWLARVLFHEPVSRFRTADARRVLADLGLRVLHVRT